jgi:hypothetical protein
MLLDQERLTAVTNYTKIRRGGGEGVVTQCDATTRAREVACNYGGSRKTKKREKKERRESKTLFFHDFPDS